LRELAGLYGIQRSYTDRMERRHRPPQESVLAVLRSLGAPIDRLEDVPDALRVRRQDLWRCRVEPVTLAWDGRLSDVRVRLPAREADGPIAGRIDTEDGERIGLPAGDPQALSAGAEVEGRTYVEIVPRSWSQATVPEGYHQLTIEAGRERSTSFLISAPSRATPPARARRWGVFLPLHALRTSRSPGIGDLTDLATVTEWVASLGGSVVATLPLLAAFSEGPLFEPSPYSPASRLFWNELFADPEAAPELERSAQARAILSSPAYRKELRGLANRLLVDYRLTMAARRRALEALARSFWAEDRGPRRRAFDAFARANPMVLDYASFRAACERHGRSWEGWPARERDGRLPADGGNPEGARYHAYAQWLVQEQLEATAGRARSCGAALYFDMPLGVNPAGYDAWRDRDAFLSGVSAGAPPDAFFTAGQNWGFRPLSPDRIRAQGYRHPIEVLRALMRHAGMLRVDHAAGLHRLFVIPTGMSAADGLYVRYRPEEFYAVLCLESRRAGTVLVGEDLGNVPLSISQALQRHGIQRTYVMQFELLKEGRRVRPPSADSVASFNTHDLAPFAGFWRALDVDRWVRLGYTGHGEAAARRGERQRQRRALSEHLVGEGLLAPGQVQEEDAVLWAALRYLAGSPARMVLLFLEDLWRETRPQNVPGTTTQYPNWRRRARFRFEAFRRLRDVASTLAEVDALRKRGERT
jgi:4-alpha-glucanotransferase